MENLFILAVIFAIISSGLTVDPFCNYNEDNVLYECLLSSANVNEEDALVKITGSHMPSKTDDDVQRIICDTSNSAHALTATFTTFKNLEILQFTSTIATSMNETNFFNCDKLKKLTLIGSSGMDTINSGTFAACTKLEEINLSTNSIVSLQNDAFIGLSSLTKLDLSQNSIVSLPAQVFQSLVELKILNLNKNEMDSLNNLLFSKTTKLETLTINSNKIVGLNAALVEKLTSLTTLDLSTNKINKMQRGFFDKMTALAEVSFSGNLCIGKDYTGGNLGTINEDFETCFKNNGATEIIIYSKLVLLIIAIGTKFL